MYLSYRRQAAAMLTPRGNGNASIIFSHRLRNIHAISINICIPCRKSIFVFDIYAAFWYADVDERWIGFGNFYIYFSRAWRNIIFNAGLIYLFIGEYMYAMRHGNFDRRDICVMELHIAVALDNRFPFRWIPCSCLLRLINMIINGEIEYYRLPKVCCLS